MRHLVIIFRYGTGRWASLEQVMRPGVALDIGRALGDDCDRLLSEGAAPAKEILLAMANEACLAFQRGLFRSYSDAVNDAARFLISLCSSYPTLSSNPPSHVLVGTPLTL